MLPSHWLPEFAALLPGDLAADLELRVRWRS
jgi:hypothetical protein